MSDTSSKQISTPDKFLEKLRTALRRDGDFPASAKSVAELRKLVSDPKTTANQVTEIILKEPSLGTRVLHLVNSSFYRRAKPIMTVSQAVVQMGMRPLAELCAGLILLQKFVPAARRGGAFANCLQKAIITSLLTSSLSAGEGSKRDKSDETGYLAGSFAELGTLLLAYYFPQVYEQALKRSGAKKQPVEKSIAEITGLTPLTISEEVIKSLDLPEFYLDVISASQGKPTSPKAEGIAVNIGGALSAARDISEVVTNSKNKQALDTALSKAQKRLQMDDKVLQKVVGELPQIFKEHCNSIELDLPTLPEYVASYSPSTSATGLEDSNSEDDVQFTQFVDEIRQAIESREPTASVITTVMETFAWCLNFDRVLLLLLSPDRRTLIGRMLLGQVSDFDPKTCRRPIGPEAAPFAPDAQAFRQSRPVFTGDPIFENGWPIAAIPVGFAQRAIGVIYADRIDSTKELDAREQAAIGMLAELLDRSVSMHQ